MAYPEYFSERPEMTLNPMGLKPSGPCQAHRVGPFEAHHVYAGQSKAHLRPMSGPPSGPCQAHALPLLKGERGMGLWAYALAGSREKRMR